MERLSKILCCNSTTGNVLNTTLTENDVGKYVAIEGKKVNATLTVLLGLAC